MPQIPQPISQQNQIQPDDGEGLLYERVISPGCLDRQGRELFVKTLCSAPILLRNDYADTRLIQGWLQDAYRFLGQLLVAVTNPMRRACYCVPPRNGPARVFDFHLRFQARIARPFDKNEQGDDS